MSYFGKMSQCNMTFDLKINLGHSDLYVMVQWFLAFNFCSEKHFSFIGKAQFRRATLSSNSCYLWRTYRKLSLNYPQKPSLSVLLLYSYLQGHWGLTEESEEEERRRRVDFLKTVIPSTRAKIAVLSQSYQVRLNNVTFEPEPDKTNKITSVFVEGSDQPCQSLLSAWRKFVSFDTHKAHSKDWMDA